MSTSSSEAPVALVTGAGRGIGAGIAHSLGAAGYRVALTARNADQLRTVADTSAAETLVLPGDITDPRLPDSLVSQVTDRWGRLDVLVANAGTGAAAPIGRTTDEQWASMLELNLTSVFRCVRAAIGPMTTAKSGAILIVASIAGRIGEPYISAYTASKHGVLGLMRSAAAELASKGVRVNAICPGYVDTPMTDATVEAIVSSTGRDRGDVRRTLEEKQAHGRLVTVAEVAEAAMSCIRNTGISGQAINVDGGTVQS